MADNEILTVAVPPLAVSIGDWDMYENPPTRVIVGRYRNVDGADINVCVAAIQDIHGQLDLVVEPPRIHLDHRPFDAPQIRALAAVLVEAADELDQWTAWAPAAQSDCHTTPITHPG